MIPGVVPPGGLTCPVCSVLRHVGQQAATGTATAIFNALTGWIVSGSGWLVQHSINVVTQSTTTDFTGHPFQHRAAPMTEMALALLLPLALIGTIGAVVRQDLRRLGRIWLVGVPVAALGTFALVTLTDLAVRIVDAMSVSLLQGRATAFSAVGRDLSRSKVPMVVKLLVGIVLVVCALMLWLEMVLRTVVIDIAVFFLPLGLAAVVWPGTAHIAKRFVEMVLAVIGSKFVVVGALVVGGVLLRGAGAGTGDAIKAVAVFLLAAFAPFALLRLVPVLELAAVAQLEGLSRRSARAVTGAASTTAGTAAAAVSAGRGFGAGSAAEGGAVGPYGIAKRVGDVDVSALGGDGSDGGVSFGGGDGADGDLGDGHPGAGGDDGSGPGGGFGGGGSGGGSGDDGDGPGAGLGRWAVPPGPGGEPSVDDGPDSSDSNAGGVDGGADAGEGRLSDDRTGPLGGLPTSGTSGVAPVDAPEVGGPSWWSPDPAQADLPDPAELAGPVPVLPVSAPGEPPPGLGQRGGEDG
ncbi:MAG TPA: hypothetical protein VKV06_02380 [Acidimicrobiales bacterium]|nr:hypothetical protein [Acidimicrobiales bacterium]